jgi:hypothetical protein
MQQLSFMLSRGLWIFFHITFCHFFHEYFGIMELAGMTTSLNGSAPVKRKAGEFLSVPDAQDPTAVGNMENSIPDFEAILAGLVTNEKYAAAVDFESLDIDLTWAAIQDWADGALMAPVSTPTVHDFVNAVPMQSATCFGTARF